MKQSRFFSAMLIAVVTLSMISCSTPMKTIAVWANREKLPPQPIKSVFIIALTDNMEVKMYLERDLARAAEARGIKAVQSIDALGPVGIKDIAPLKEVFEKKLAELGSEAIFTVAMVNQKSETRYVPSSSEMYTPYGYGSYAGYGGYGPYGGYGGFGGYYGYTVNVISTPGYYSTDNTYFLDNKLFDVKTGELLLSIQSKVANPPAIEKASKMYTDLLMQEIKELNLRGK